MKESLLTLSITSFICLCLIGVYELFRTESLIVAVSCTLMWIIAISFIAFIFISEKEKQNETK